MQGVRFTFSVVIFFLRSYGLVAKITVEPRDTDAVVGQLTYLNCSISDPTKGVSWFYYPVSHSGPPIDIYQVGSLQGSHGSRAKVEKDSNTGAFNLVLNQVQKSDAGRYTCQEEDGKELKTAELVVLDTIPICGSNTKGNKIIGSSRCDLQNEEIYLSCFTSYSGNSPPTIQWKSTNKGNIIEGVESTNIDNNITSILPIREMLKSDFFTCETTRAALKQYGCSPGPINIIDVSHNYMITKKNVGEEATCLAKTSLHCIYKWIWFDGIHEEVVSHTPGVTLQKQGIYRCEAECITKEKQCLIIAGLVHVTTCDDSVKWRVFCWLLIVVVLALLTVGGIMMWKRSKHCRLKRFQTPPPDSGDAHGKKSETSGAKNENDEKPRDASISTECAQRKNPSAAQEIARYPDEAAALISTLPGQTDQTATEETDIPYPEQAEDRNEDSECEEHQGIEGPTSPIPTGEEITSGVHPDHSGTGVHRASGDIVISDEVQSVAGEIP